MSTKEKQRRRRVGKQKRVEATARTKLKYENLGTPEVIQLSNKEDDNTMKTNTDQATEDLTINTQAAADFGGDVPPAETYEGPDGDDLLDPAVEETPVPGSTGVEMATEELIPNEIKTDEEEKRSVTNAELCDEALAAAKLAANAEEKDPAGVAISEFSLKQIRDAEWFRNIVLLLMFTAGTIGFAWNVFWSKANTQWLKLCLVVKTKTDKLFAWAGAKTTEFGVKWQERFPKLATRDDLMAFANIVAGVFEKSHDDYNEHIDVLTNRINKLELALAGKAPRTISADKLIDFAESLKKGENVKLIKQFAVLTGATTAEAKKAIEALA